MTLQPTSVTQAIRNELRRICQTEQTEAHVFAVLCERPDDFENGNYCPAAVESVIDDMLDRRELLSRLQPDRMRRGKHHAALIVNHWTPGDVA